MKAHVVYIASLLTNVVYSFTTNRLWRRKGFKLKIISLSRSGHIQVLFIDVNLMTYRLNLFGKPR